MDHASEAYEPAADTAPRSHCAAAQPAAAALAADTARSHRAAAQPTAAALAADTSPPTPTLAPCVSGPLVRIRVCVIRRVVYTGTTHRPLNLPRRPLPHPNHLFAWSAPQVVRLHLLLKWFIACFVLNSVDASYDGGPTKSGPEPVPSELQVFVRQEVAHVCGEFEAQVLDLRQKLLELSMCTACMPPSSPPSSP
eukprot:scaffold54221_cov55-Phaeocystis_antarctica.AAC.1